MPGEVADAGGRGIHPELAAGGSLSAVLQQRQLKRQKGLHRLTTELSQRSMQMESARSAGHRKQLPVH